MTYDFGMFVPKISSVREVYCNLNKGDSEHKMDQYIRYTGTVFVFVDYQAIGLCVQDMIDYTVLDEAELFQELLVYDKKYLCTLEEIIGIQNKMKEHRRICVEMGDKNMCYFNL